MLNAIEIITELKLCFSHLQCNGLGLHCDHRDYDCYL